MTHRRCPSLAVLLLPALLGAPALQGQDVINTFLGDTFKVFKKESDRLAAQKAFLDATRTSVLIENTSNKTWYVGFDKQPQDRKGKTESGTLEVRTVSSLNGKIRTDASLKGDEEPYWLLPGETIILVPIHESWWVVGSAEFNRTLYLKDGNGRKTYFQMYRYGPKDAPSFGYLDPPARPEDGILHLSAAGHPNFYWIVKDRT